MKTTFEVTCCTTGAHYWLLDTRDQAVEHQEKLLRTGHISVVIYEVTRRAISMKQPRADAGEVCKRAFGEECDLDHNHWNIPLNK